MPSGSVDFWQIRKFVPGSECKFGRGPNRRHRYFKSINKARQVKRAQVAAAAGFVYCYRLGWLQYQCSINYIYWRGICSQPVLDHFGGIFAQPSSEGESSQAKNGWFRSSQSTTYHPQWSASTPSRTSLAPRTASLVHATSGSHGHSQWPLSDSVTDENVETWANSSVR